MLNVKRIRQMRKIRQDEVAAYLNISRSAYTNIENNKRDPDTGTLIALADFFKVSLDDLFERTSPTIESGFKNTRLKELREKLELSATDVSKGLGIPVTRYAKYETGEAIPDINILYRLSDKYGVTIDYLLGHETMPQLTDNLGNTLSDVETKLLMDFRSINRQGKEYILQTMAMAVTIYKNDVVPDLENRA